MITKFRQPALLAALGLLLLAVLYRSLVGVPTTSTEVGFDAPTNLRLTDVDLVEEIPDNSRWPSDHRNPFDGPFSLSGLDENGQGSNTGEKGEDSSESTTEDIPIKPSELAPQETFEDLADIPELQVVGSE